MPSQQGMEGFDGAYALGGPDINVPTDAFEEHGRIATTTKRYTTPCQAGKCQERQVSYHRSLRIQYPSDSTMLVTALPKQALHTFTSDLTLPASLLVQLLQSQPQLRYLSTRVDNPGSDEPVEVASVGGAPWLASSLSQLAELNVYVHSQSTPKNDESQFRREFGEHLCTRLVRPEWLYLR
jgi:hypothetical protein